MLGKLVKNEIKHSAHTMAGIYLSALITIVIMGLAYLADIPWLSTLSTFALIAIACLSVVITFIGIIVNFNKTLFRDQGYLSFTLPVKTSQLLASKAIVAFFWMILSYVIAIALFGCVTFYVNSLIGENNIALIKALLNIFANLPAEKSLKQLLAVMAAGIFIQLAFLISELFFAITFSNTRVMQKTGTFGAILIFFAVFVVSQIGLFVFTNYIPLAVLPTETGLSLVYGKTMAELGGMSFGISGILFQLLAGAGLFWATGWLMEHKVNIK